MYKLKYVVNKIIEVCSSTYLRMTVSTSGTLLRGPSISLLRATTQRSNTSTTSCRL